MASNSSDNIQEISLDGHEPKSESLAKSLQGDDFGVNENYVIVDIGANLTNKKFTRDLDSVVSRAQDAGVTKIIVPGTTVHSSKEALRLTHLYPGVLYSTAGKCFFFFVFGKYHIEIICNINTGVHPHEAKTWGDDTLDELRSLLQQQEVVAVGECGLDFNRNFSPPELQIQVFEKQVELACTLKKPLIVHERDAHAEVLAVLRRHTAQLPASVIHCFTGDADTAKAYLQLGCYIGITGYAWKDKSSEGVRQILNDGILPLDRLLVETDAPFMYPNTRASKLPQHVKQGLTQR
ncbi:hypothetical protein HAZT_HAZT000262 [Hyalella azteca]|uniref:Deoxyribonuclease TATDN1 n=1 Tax=Hyalella azteca TaxID=294128 RepID=A0A6A0H804_HYAAZ|nr:hypothetical protein HAZT_HAZT000262 [Hyalella azteca]